MSAAIKYPRIPMILFLTVLFLLPVSQIYATSNGTRSAIGGPDNAGSSCDSPRTTRTNHFAPVLECGENTTKSAYPGHTVVFNCTVKNEGNMTDDYKVTSTAIPGWNIILYPDKFPRIPPVTIPANESEKIKDLTVRVVVGEMSAATVGNYSFEVTLRSQLSPSNISTMNFTVRVLPLHRIEIITPQEKTRLPGEEAMYEFEIWNTGNVDGIYEIWVESSDPDWVVILVDDSMETLNLHIGDMRVAPVLVFIPQDADAGYVHRTSFAARLKGESSVHVERGIVGTKIGNITRIKVNQDGLERTRDGIPGDEISFTFEIINTGNNLDEIIGSTGSFVLSRIPDTPANWGIHIDNAPVKDIGLPKDMAANISLIVTIPPFTPPGIYEFVVDIYSDIPLTYQDQASFEVNVLSFHDAEMEFKVTSKDANIGDNVTFTALLNNTGNMWDSYSCEVESQYSHWLWMDVPGFTVDFGNTHEVIFNIRIPDDAPVGTYDFLFTLFSEGDENLSFKEGFELKVAETLDFSFSALNETYDAVIGSEILLPLNVSNIGNADLPLSLDIFGESWGILEHRNLFLRYKESKELTISFNPPLGIDPTDYSFLIIGEMIMGVGVEKTITVNINVIDPVQTGEYFGILFTGGGFELQIEGEKTNSTAGPFGTLDDYLNSWPGISDDVFHERYVVSGTTELDLRVRPGGEDYVENISREKYSLVIIKVMVDDAAAIVLNDMGFEGNSEEHRFMIEWPRIDKPYDMWFTRLFEERSYQICATGMVMDRNESDTYNILFHDDEYDLVITKVEVDGNSLTVDMKDMPLDDSERMEYEIDWSKVATDESDAVILSYRNEGGNVLDKFTLSPVSTGRDLIEGEVDDMLLSVENLSFIIGIIILTILLGTGVVVKGKTIRDRNMLTRYSVVGIVSMNEGGITFEDLCERMAVIKNRLKLGEKIIKKNIDILIANDQIYTRSVRGIPHYHVKDDETPIRFGRN